MERALLPLAALLLVGCGLGSSSPPVSGGGPAPAGGPAPVDGSTPAGAFQRPEGMAGEIWVDVPDDVQASLRALATTARPLVTACAEGPLKGLTAEVATASGFPFDLPTLDAACGPAAALYDANVGLLGKSRSGDGLLSDLARLADDLDYLHRAAAPDQQASERGNAVNHVRDALNDAFQGLDELERGAIWPYHTVGYTPPEGWAHAVAGNHAWLVRLRETLGKLAFLQGTDPRYVRRRMLESFFVGAALDGDLRAATLPQLALAPDELAARQRYQQVESATLAALRETELAYVRGEITTEAARTAAIARVDAAMAAYEAAWAAETARVGPDPSPNP